MACLMRRSRSGTGFIPLNCITHPEKRNGNRYEAGNLENFITGYGETEKAAVLALAKKLELGGWDTKG